MWLNDLLNTLALREPTPQYKVETTWLSMEDAFVARYNRTTGAYCGIARVTPVRVGNEFYISNPWETNPHMIRIRRPPMELQHGNPVLVLQPNKQLPPSQRS